MKRGARTEMTLEEYQAWSKAGDKVEAVADSADEQGGPRLSLVPLPEQNIAWPTDLLAPAADPNDGGAAPTEAMAFDGVPLEDSRKRLAGWSAERQRLFLTILAETGQVHLACAAARLSARSAYALRVRSPAFAKGWSVAEQLAVGRLVPMAFDRAINGRIEQVYQDGSLVAERRPAADLAHRPARPPALRPAVGAARRCRSAVRRQHKLRRRARRARRRRRLIVPVTVNIRED